MGPRGANSLALLLLVCVVGAHAGSYLVTAPKKYIKGSPYEVTIDILNATLGQVQVVASLQDTVSVRNSSGRFVDSLTRVSAVTTVTPGVTGTVVLPIATNLICDSCRLQIRGTGGLQIDASTNVYADRKLLSILVQTDKAIYRPGQVVRYRALAVYPNLSVASGMFIIRIYDPRDNVIQFRRNVTSEDGVVEGSLVLSEQPMFGDWNVEVTLNAVTETSRQPFTVADYELPRFEVTVDLPPYGLVADAQLTGTVKAQYTFGQPVTGMVELHVGPNRGPDFCGKLPDTTQIAFKIENGEANFAVPKEDFGRAVGYIGDGTQVKVTAYVTEDATGVRLNGSSVVTLYRNDYKIQFLENTPDVFKPGLQYTAFLQLTTPNDMPPTHLENRRVSVYTSATYSVTLPDQSLYDTYEFRGTYPLPGQNLTFPANGILPVDISIPRNATEITIKATFRDESVTQNVLNAYSRGNTFIQLTLEDQNVKSNTMASFSVKGTEPLGQVSYTILARGGIVSTGILNGQGRTEFTFDLSVEPSMAPTAHIIVYYSKDQDEVVADSLAFNVDGLFSNEVAVSFSRNSSEPALDISLGVTAEPSSTVCVLAVDQSVLLLKSGNDITAEKVSDEISKFDSGREPSSSEFALSYGSETSREAFSSVGLLVISDVNFRRPPPPNRGPSYFGKRDQLPIPRAVQDSLFASPEMVSAGSTGPVLAEQSLAQVERVRNIFPETWLWGRDVAGPDGSVNFQTRVPDTITSWVASAFAVHSTAGLGVAPTTSKLQVFRPFFVSLTYPNRAVRGEKVVVQATVFNYLGTDAVVRVTMKSSSNYTILRVAADGTETPQSQDVYFDIEVPTDKQGVVYFPILTTQLGLASIEVTAQTASAADGVRRTIFVRPEGAAVSYNVPMFVSNAAQSSRFVDGTTLSLPDSAVPGSANSRVKVTGDLIGASLDSLTSLLALPTGCGEQSMVKFAPDLYIYQYLQATGQLTRAYRNRIRAYLESGLQRQLTYQRSDGGFSAFGERDSASSTWLTAFVIRAFVEARRVIYVDDGILEKGVNWLVDRIERDGSFREFGNVLDRTVQATSNREYLTAYVLLTLVQSRAIFPRFRLRVCERNGRKSRLSDFVPTCNYVNATRKAMRYLEGRFEAVDDQLTLSVISLALSRAGSSSASEAFGRLQNLVTQSGALSFWTDNTTVPVAPRPRLPGSVFRPTWSPPSVQARPLDILITSYAILTFIQLDQSQLALPAVRWLVEQKNNRGGFVSTQDTVLGLEALSRYAANTISADTNLAIRVLPTVSGDIINFSVTRQNALSLQIRELPLLQDQPTAVGVEATGLGTALVEFDVRFTVEEELSTPSFDVNTVLLNDDIDTFNLMVCTKWLWDRPTGMVVQEISIPSGFEPDLHSTQNVAGMKKAERKGDVVEVYFDEITKSSLCYSIIMTRTSKVAQTQKNYVRTYDYYAPADQSTVFYQPVKLRDSTICDVCDGCCA